MKLKWQWFLGGRGMFWATIIVFIALILVFTVTYLIDPISSLYMKKQNIDESSIREISEGYVKSCGIKIDKPIVYRFVEYSEQKSNKNGEILLGTFHEWNNTYYIDISKDIFDTLSKLESTVIHETRHMIVQHLKNKRVINLVKYTEEIAYEENSYYNGLFDSGVYLLKTLQEKE